MTVHVCITWDMSVNKGLLTKQDVWSGPEMRGMKDGDLSTLHVLSSLSLRKPT